jgi:hypothetical protein
MKITIGGEVGYTLQRAPFESIQIKTSVHIESETEIPEIDAEDLNEKIRKIIKEENRKKLKTAVEEYKTKLEEIKRM